MGHLYSSNTNRDNGSNYNGTTSNGTTSNGTTSSTRNILRAISHTGPCFNQPDPEPL